jgi:ABC-type sugar transport system ATPase subunit
MSDALLELRHVSKSFPGLKALDDVSVSVGAGEIVALIGQNGSGKSTLVKVLAGVHVPDPGSEIVLATGPDQLAIGPDQAQTELHFIHQDLGLVEGLSTIENLDLARRLGPRGVFPFSVRRERRVADELIARFGGTFDVSRPVAALSPGERALVAVARALSEWEHPRNVLVLDEPTASLHGDEVQRLFTAVRRVAERGAGVIFISHRLDEVIELADRVVILRDGRVVANARRGTLGHDDLVRLIAGEAETGAAVRERSRGATPLLRARAIRGSTIASLDLDLHAGEVLGVSGVLGSGREEVASILFGATPGEVAEFAVDGRPLTDRTPRSSIAAGLAYVPGDRRRNGAVMTESARENLTLPHLRPLRRWLGSIDRVAERAEADAWIKTTAVRPPEPERPLHLFSGGNQQKIVLAKWLRTEPKVLLMDEPTQGVDVGARAAIFALIQNVAANGAGVLICSSDTKELSLICDRVIVMRDGRAAAEVAGSQLSEEALVLASLGPGSFFRPHDHHSVEGAS